MFIPPGGVAKLLAVIFAIHAFASFSVSAQDASPSILDDYIITDLGQKSAKPYAPKDFTADPNLGLVWVVLIYIADIALKKDGVTVFEVTPTDVKVSGFMGNHMMFQSQYMAPYLLDMDVAISFGGKTKILSQREFMNLMTPKERKQYQANIKAAEKAIEKTRQLVQVNHYNVLASKVTQVGVSMNTLANMKPGPLQVIVGQGKLPADLIKYMEKSNGSWFSRYRNFVLMVITALVVGFFALRALRKS